MKTSKTILVREHAHLFEQREKESSLDTMQHDSDHVQNVFHLSFHILPLVSCISTWKSGGIVEFQTDWVK